jgi:RNA polymerase sigma-70 factor (ECF subfamily)
VIPRQRLAVDTASPDPVASTTLESTPLGHQELVARIGAGDRQAFATLVRRYYASLCDFVYRRVGSREVAEDIVQEVFIRIWERGDTWDCREPEAYLYRAVRNRTLMHHRAERVRARWRATFGAAEAIDERTADEQMRYDELVQMIEQGVSRLPERCRMVYTMSRVQGMSHADIARAMGISIKTVEVQMGRALKSLRAHLAPYLSIGIVVVCWFGLACAAAEVLFALT